MRDKRKAALRGPAHSILNPHADHLCSQVQQPQLPRDLRASDFPGHLFGEFPLKASRRFLAANDLCVTHAG